MSEYLTTAQVAERLGPYSVQFVRRLARERVIPAIRLGRRWLFDWSAVKRALSERGESESEQTE